MPHETTSSSAKPRRTQLERNLATRQKLVASAIELLKKKRYAGFRVTEVAEMAGVSRGAQTHHYPQKDGLLIEAVEEVYRRTQAKALERVATPKRSAAELLDGLIADGEDFFMGEDFILSLDLLMVGGEDPLGQEIKRLAQQYRPSVEKAWLEAFVQAGYDPDDAEDVITMTFSLARGLAVRQLIDADKTRAQRLMPRWRKLANEILNTSRRRSNKSRE